MPRPSLNLTRSWGASQESAHSSHTDTMLKRNFMIALAATALATVSLGAQDTAARLDRDVMKKRVQERFGALIKERLQLTDSQAVRLAETNRRFEEQRRMLIQQERDVRMSLRDELMAQDQQRADQERIATLLDRAIRVQRQRVDLLESEQRELARFLNATQRAKLLGMQEQMRRNAMEMRGRGPEIRDRMRDGRRDRGQRPMRRPTPRFRPPTQ